jgi:hypothetical protein
MRVKEQRFAEVGREKLAAANGLTVAENDELHHTPVIDRTIELVLNGVSAAGGILPAKLIENECFDMAANAFISFDTHKRFLHASQTGNVLEQ